MVWVMFVVSMAARSLPEYLKLLREEILFARDRVERSWMVRAPVNWSAILRGIKVLVPSGILTNRLRKSPIFLGKYNQHDGFSMATLVYRSVKYPGKTKHPNCSAIVW